MDIDVLLMHYFGTDDPDLVSTTTLGIGKQRLAIDFGVERDPGRRFALWTLMDVFAAAPPPAEAFAEPEEAGLRRAAEEYLTAAWRIERDGE
jgi:hypothetical protein